MKQSSIEQEGIVLQACSNATFRVQLENDIVIFCTVNGRMRQHFIQVMPGDKVKVEMSPYDLTKGRITQRLRQGGAYKPRPTHRKFRR